MKYKHFLLCFCNVFLVLCLLGVYQLVLYARTMQERQAEMQAKVEQLEEEVQTWSQAVEEAAKQTAAVEAEAEETKTNGYADGVYQGTAQGFGGDITVSVEIADGQMVSLEIVSAEQEDDAYLSMAEEILAAIVENQTTEVDTISGATYSSAGIRDAVAQALLEAEQGE